jgi:hypothetical protein
VSSTRNCPRGLAILAVILEIALVGCGPSPITGDRIERAIAPTFANLVHVQLSRLALAAVDVRDIKVIASCYRAGGGKIGAGDWTCTLIWSGPNRVTLHDRFEVAVTTDGCYTATVDKSESQLGGPTIITPDGREVRNVLYTFEGCFNTT